MWYSPVSRQRALRRLEASLVDGVLTIEVWNLELDRERNRQRARHKMSVLLADAISPQGALPALVRSSGAARDRRLRATRRRSRVKESRVKELRSRHQ